MYPSKLAAALLCACCSIVNAAPDEAALTRAVEAQDALVRGWPAEERIAGYKIAFAGEAMQQRFGLVAPAMAVLPASAERCVGTMHPCVVDFAGYSQPAMELEIALRLASDITEVPASTMQLLPYIEAVMPAIELPELALGEGVAPASGLDYIASNIGTRGYLLGAPRLPIVLLQRGTTLQLRRGTEVLLQGAGDGAADAALQLVRQALARGYALRAGQILLSGAIGGMTPGKAGAYVADCGSLGVLEFTVR